jgi:hypothetical protein
MSRMPEDMTEETVMIALVALALSIVVLPVFSFEASAVTSQTASSSLSSFVDEELEANCQGGGTAGWTLRPLTYDFKGSIDTIDIDSGDTFNATLEGEQGFVEKAYSQCSTIEICEWGTSASTSDPESCPTGTSTSEIRVAAKQGSPEMDVYYNTNQGKIIIDPIE